MRPFIEKVTPSVLVVLKLLVEPVPKSLTLHVYLVDSPNNFTSETTPVGFGLSDIKIVQGPIMVTMTRCSL